MVTKELLRRYLPAGWIAFYHELRAILAAYYYRFPARHLRVIGVTGTNGKTTTCHLIAAILEQAGYRVGMATTIDFKIGTKVVTNGMKMTTPDPFILQRLLREMVGAGCHYAVVETTSHAIAQQRIWGIRYEIVVLTNITHEHLDYHKSMEEYRAVKLRLFAKNPRVSIVNADDRAAADFTAQPAYQHYTYALENKADLVARKLIPEVGGTMFTAVTPAGQLTVDLKLPGRFNVYNTLAALAVGVSQGVDLTLMKKALEKVEGVAGRMEQIELGQNFRVVIDYAHTPDALEQVYRTLAPLKKRRLISVLGAAGDRDKTKRPLLGALAGKYADYVIITNEDPYTEEPQSIIDQVSSGVPRGRPRGEVRRGTGEGTWWWRISDRREAIQKALTLAQEDDLVLITGKGAETVMVVGEKHLPWSDRAVVKGLLSRREVPNEH